MSIRRTYRWTALIAATAIAIGLGGSASGAEGASDAGDFDEVENLIKNPRFDTTYDGWSAYGVTGGVEDGVFCGEYFGPHARDYDAGFGFNGLSYPAGDYFVSFDARADAPFVAKVQESWGKWALLARLDVPASDEMASYEMAFHSDTPFANGEFHFHLGTPVEGELSFCVDNVVVKVIPTDFAAAGGLDGGLGSWSATGATPTFTDAGVCLAVPEGTTASSDVSLRLNGIALPAFDYTVRYDAIGEGPPVRAVVSSTANPSNLLLDMEQTPTAESDTYTEHFSILDESDTVDFALEMGGGAGGEVCLDTVQLVSGGEPPPFEPVTGPRVRVNQLGYEPDGPKRATLVTRTTESVAWRLVNGEGVKVAEGQTTPVGLDASSGLEVQLIDFSEVTAEGEYTLIADSDTSYPFVIQSSLYRELRDGALNYFYLARSGIEIDPAIVGDAYAREAGHLGSPGGTETNQGDYAVACQPAGDSQAIYGEPWTCDYTLDVVGGWYDAGDHGKYVVNGGIATYQLLAAYERILRADGDARDALGDSVLALPETGNGIPDILDEAKWELDFMMSMMVPEGDPLVGMVHHKVHDFSWTELPLAPADAPNTRYLHRPSTAATLNLAATAAQGARLYGDFDKDYAEQLLEVAETAWNAAVANPDVYAPVADGAAGGGPYDDDNVSDEFYWAAAELYLTTGDAAYEEFLLASDLNTADVFDVGGFGWKSTAALGRMDLATVDSDFPDREAVRASVVAGADEILAVQQGEAFGQALAAEGFGWGSNSQILNNQVVLATAYDLTSDVKYLNAVRESMDYLLGRNSLNQSYITGFGTIYSQNQHSRWFAAQLDSSLPHPPPGSVAGGPNAVVASWDPAISALYPKGDCAPQRCYVDEIQSWSTNEITINWNSALGWVSTFLVAPEAPVVESGSGPGWMLWLGIALGVLLIVALAWRVTRRRADATELTPVAPEAPVKKATVKKPVAKKPEAKKPVVKKPPS